MRSETSPPAAIAPDPQNRSTAALAHRVLIPKTGQPVSPLQATLQATPQSQDPHPSGRKSDKPMSRSKPTSQDPFMSIDASELTKVAGGASRVTARSNSSTDQLTAMMTQITQSIQALSQNNNQSDPMQMMMMMMMMGGMGGGGGAAAAPAPAPAPQPPVINISTTVKRHGW